MEANDWVTAAIAVLALIVACLSWWASHRSAVASEDSAASARRSAAAEEAGLELERQDRADADMQRRVNVWHQRPVHAHAAEFKFLGAEAHHVFFEANVVLEVGRRKSTTQSPMYKGDRMIIVAQDPEGWNRRVTISWAESEGADVERLSKLMVV